MLTHSDHRRRVTRKTARTGLTLIEILMTIFVLAVGLLGVAALMPVGSYQMQRGQIAQRVSEIGPAALDFIESTSMHSPRRWHTGSVAFDDVKSHGDEDEWVRKAHTSAASVAAVADADSGTHLLEFIRSDDATKLGQYHVPGAPGASVSSGTNDVAIVRRCEPFAIDPLYLYHPQAGLKDDSDDDSFIRIRNEDGPFGPATSMPRITLHGVTTSDIAEVIFQNDEDLTVVEDETGMTSGRAVHGSTANPVKSKSEGNYSWLATFAPGEIDSGSDPRYWTVSVAVFYKRPLGLQDDAGNNLSQWTVPFSTSGGNNGYTTVTLDGSTSADIYAGRIDLTDPTEPDKQLPFDQDAGDSMRIKRRMWGAGHV